jgi:DNA-binding HxlR family transcriptional regulator
MAEGDKQRLHSEIRELNRRIEDLERIIARFQEPVDRMRDLAGNYLRMMDSLIRLGAVPQEDIFEGIADDISREIIRVLLKRNGQNISQITEGVRQRRGTASRRIVRERLQSLERDGKVRRDVGSKAAVYVLSEEMVRKWSQLLGLFK